MSSSLLAFQLAPIYLATVGWSCIQQLAGPKYLVLRHILEATRPLLSKGVNSRHVQVMLDSMATQFDLQGFFRQGQAEKELNESAYVDHWSFGRSPP